MKKVVVFGAGLVVRAHVRYLLDHGFHVTVASRTVSKAEEIIDGHPNGTPMAYDVTAEPERLEHAFADARESVREAGRDRATGADQPDPDARGVGGGVFRVVAVESVRGLEAVRHAVG